MPEMEMRPGDKGPNPAARDGPPPPPDASRTPPDPRWKSGVLSVVIHQINNLERQNLKGTTSKDREGQAGQDTDDPAEEAGHLPSSYCELIVNDDLIYKTRVKQYSSMPFFEAGTEVFVRNWEKAVVRIVVRDSALREKDPILGIGGCRSPFLVVRLCAYSPTLSRRQSTSNSSTSLLRRAKLPGSSPSRKASGSAASTSRSSSSPSRWSCRLICSDGRLAQSSGSPFPEKKTKLCLSLPENDLTPLPPFFLSSFLRLLSPVSIELDGQHDVSGKRLVISTSDSTEKLSMKEAEVNGQTMVWDIEHMRLPVYSRFQVGTPPSLPSFCCIHGLTSLLTCPRSVCPHVRASESLNPRRRRQRG